VLVVEDSRFACEAMRLLCLRSGARIRRADSLKAAHRHLRVYRPTALIIDIGLPDGSGLDLITALHQGANRPDIVLATSGDPLAEEAAIAAGADGFLPKPVTSLAVFQDALLQQLPSERQPAGPRPVPVEEVAPDTIAYHDDLAHVADVLAEDGPATALDYVAQFLSGVARSAHDTPLEQAALALAAKRASGDNAVPEAAVLSNMVAERLDRRVAI